MCLIEPKISIKRIKKGYNHIMDMKSKNQYLQTLIQEKGYHLKSKKEKSKLLQDLRTFKNVLK